MKKTRVLVVEDSLTIRKYVVDVLASAPDVEVVGEAADGREAIERCERLRPDVITMDMMLPVMSGVAATEYIMAHFPTPILIVSASANRGEAFRTYEALAAGAVDVLDKPKAHSGGQEWERKLLAAVRLVAKIRVITHPRGKLAARIGVGGPRPEPGEYHLLAIGGSTGAPAAVADILRVLPADYPIPLLLVIHVAELFAYALAEWLGTQARLPVRAAVDGERLPSYGTPGVLLAPAGRHLTVEAGYIRLTNAAERHSCRPSVDVLFESVAREMPGRAALCLLTGMGKDGAAGLLTARRSGCLTIAQDENTSVVWGMPGEAVRLGAAGRVLPLEAIAPALMSLVATAERRNV